MNRLLDFAVIIENELVFQPIVDVIRAARRQTCVFCEGVGHGVKECTTKSKLDRTFKKLSLKAEWGGMKCRIIRENIKATTLAMTDIRNVRIAKVNEITQPRRTLRNRLVTQRTQVLALPNANPPPANANPPPPNANPPPANANPGNQAQQAQNDPNANQAPLNPQQQQENDPLQIEWELIRNVFVADPEYNPQPGNQQNNQNQAQNQQGGGMNIEHP